MGIEDMTPEEAIKDEVPTTLYEAAVRRKGATVLSYADLHAAVLKDRELDIEIVAKNAGFASGVAYLRHLDFKFDGESDNLILPEVGDSHVAMYMQAKDKEDEIRAAKKGLNQQPVVSLVNYKPNIVDVNGVATRVYETHIFDGDVSKLMPGMHIKIPGGPEYDLPIVCEIDPTDDRTKKFAKRDRQKYNKKVREIVENYNKNAHNYEKLRALYQKPQE